VLQTTIFTKNNCFTELPENIFTRDPANYSTLTVLGLSNIRPIYDFKVCASSFSHFWATSQRLLYKWPKMAPSRAPLMELSAQGHNRLKMSQQTYGKHRRTVVVQASLWESPGGIEELAPKKSATPILESNDDDEGSDSKKSTTPVLEPPDHDDEEGGYKESTTPPGSPINGDDQLVIGFQDLAIASDEITASTGLDEERAKSLPAKRVTRGSNKANTNKVALPSEVDITALLAESYAHTKSSTKISVHITTFREFGAKLNKHFAIQKLNDGSFGDVYKLIPHSTTKASSKNKLESLGGGVLKIIPLAGKTGHGSRKFSRVESVLSEVRVLRALDSLHGMTRFRDVHVVIGRYPDSFVEAYVEFNKNVRTGDAPNPVKFTDTQLYAIVDMDDAGTDIGSLDSVSIFQAYDVFWGAVIVLANAEKEAEFEARDMHNGNICVRSITPNGTIEVPDHQLSTWSENQTMHLGLTGMRLTLIDYTLSRARLEDNSIAFQDLKDIKFLFTRPGQQPASIQQRAYDQMRDAVRAASASNTSTSKKEDWSLSVPRTNIVWLYYLLTLFLEHDLWVPEASNAACLRAQDAMRTKLESVLVGLEAGATGEGACFGSAGELLEGVLESGLLGREEVEGYVKQLESEQ
jgi:hypothetical protein